MLQVPSSNILLTAIAHENLLSLGISVIIKLINLRFTLLYDSFLQYFPLVEDLMKNRWKLSASSSETKLILPLVKLRG
jgi:hypothetical protein